MCVRLFACVSVSLCLCARAHACVRVCVCVLAVGGVCSGWVRPWHCALARPSWGLGRLGCSGGCCARCVCVRCVLSALSAIRVRVRARLCVYGSGCLCASLRVYVGACVCVRVRAWGEAAGWGESVVCCVATLVSGSLQGSQRVVAGLACCLLMACLAFSRRTMISLRCFPLNCAAHPWVPRLPILLCVATVLLFSASNWRFEASLTVTMWFVVPRAFFVGREGERSCLCSRLGSSSFLLLFLSSSVLRLFCSFLFSLIFLFAQCPLCELLGSSGAELLAD